MSESPPVAIDESPSLARVTLSGALGIEHAAELSARLRALVAHPGRVQVEWNALEHADACVLQLLLAFTRARASQGAGVEHGPASPEVRAFLALGGFAAHFGGMRAEECA